jgi:hypothetical protein
MVFLFFVMVEMAAVLRCIFALAFIMQYFTEYGLRLHNLVVVIEFLSLLKQRNGVGVGVPGFSGLDGLQMQVFTEVAVLHVEGLLRDNTSRLL